MKIDELLELLLYFSCILPVTDNAFRLLSVYRLHFDLHTEFALFASKLLTLACAEIESTLARATPS